MRCMLRRRWAAKHLSVSISGLWRSPTLSATWRCVRRDQLTKPALGLRRPVARHERAEPGFGRRYDPAVETDHLHLLQLAPDARHDIPPDRFDAGSRSRFSKHGFCQYQRRRTLSRWRLQIDRPYLSRALQ